MASMDLTGGDRMSGALGSILAKLGQRKLVRVGFLEGSTYSDGTSIPMVAVVNEFGATINREAGEQTIYRSLKANGDLAQGGRFVRAAKSNFASTHAVGAYKIIIPARPFFRTMIAEKSPGWGVMLAKALKTAKYDPYTALGRMGEVIKSDLQDSIREWSDPPNAPSTIAGKGFNKPLIADGTLLNSVDWEVDL